MTYVICTTYDYYFIIILLLIIKRFSINYLELHASRYDNIECMTIINLSGNVDSNIPKSL